MKRGAQYASVLATLLLGSAVLLITFVALKGTMVSETSTFIDTIRPEILSLVWILAISSLLHLLMVWGEASLTHGTAHARLAVWEMVHGRYKTDFWIGIVLSLAGAVIPALALYGMVSSSFAVAGAPLALMGLMLYEHAYVQAGQSVPLA